MEETYSTDNIKNVSSGHSSNVKYSEKSSEKEKNDLFSPKFNEDSAESHKKSDIKELMANYVHTKESKKCDNCSQKQSEFTFNNGKDLSMSGSNTFIQESENSSRVKFGSLGLDFQF